MKRFNVFRDDEWPNSGYYDAGSYDTLAEADEVRCKENSMWMSRYMLIYDNKLNKRVNLSEEPWKSMIK